MTGDADAHARGNTVKSSALVSTATTELPDYRVMTAHLVSNRR